MAQESVSALSQFLNYGGLGLLAILCLVVLGYNAWNLNSLIAKAKPERIQAAKGLLLAQMGLSLIGLLSVGSAAVYLDRLKVDDGKTRLAQILLDPWDNDIDAKSRPVIRIAGGGEITRPIRVICKPGEPATVNVDFKPYIMHMLENSVKSQKVLLPIADAPAVE